jgi:hypothetical protein
MPSILFQRKGYHLLPTELILSRRIALRARVDGLDLSLIVFTLDDGIGYHSSLFENFTFVDAGVAETRRKERSLTNQLLSDIN